MNKNKIFYYISVGGKFIDISELGQNKEDLINNECIDLLKMIDKNKCYYHSNGAKVLSVFYENNALKFSVHVCCNAYASELILKFEKYIYPLEIIHLRPDAQFE